MAWENLDEDIAAEFSGLEGCFDPAAGLHVISEGRSASELAVLRAQRAGRRAVVWMRHLMSGQVLSRCAGWSCHNLLTPAPRGRYEWHCSPVCRKGSGRRRINAQRARLVRLWDQAGARLWQRQRSGGTTGGDAAGASPAGATGPHE